MKRYYLHYLQLDYFPHLSSYQNVVVPGLLQVVVEPVSTSTYRSGYYGNLTPHMKCVSILQ